MMGTKILILFGLKITIRKQIDRHDAKINKFLILRALHNNLKITNKSNFKALEDNFKLINPGFFELTLNDF